MTEGLLARVAAIGVAAAVILKVADRVMSTIAGVTSRQADAHERALKVLSDSVASTAQAVGQAVQTAMAPVPMQAPTPHELAGQMYMPEVESAVADQADDLDPTDHFIQRERGEVMFVGADDDNPTGIPGLQFPGV